jgi:hypothetical protein
VTLVTVARLSSVAGAIVWLLGLPLITLSSVPFTSDATFYLFGILIVLLGLAGAPVALAYPSESAGRSVSIIRGLGVIVCAVLVVTGALVVAGSTGRLGDRAPGWIPGASLIGLIGFFAWVLLASFSTRRSTTLGRGASWLGLFAGASVLVPVVISVLLFFFDPGFILTDATVPLQLLSALLVWVCLPAWLIVFAVRLHAARKDPGKGVHAAPAVATAGEPAGRKLVA